MIDGAIYKTIAAVSADLAKDGISKSRTNAQQGYKFRGIDEVLNALAPVLSKHGLVILPRILTRTCTERPSQKGGVIFTVVVEAEFDFVALDGSTHVVRTFGEAMDSADKATNKAMSAAYKYAAFQAFCIPTEGDNDGDAHTPEPAPPRREPIVPTPAISEPQQKRFFAIAKQHGWKPAEVKALLTRVCGVGRSDQIPVTKYDDICKLLERGVEAAAKA